MDRQIIFPIQQVQNIRESFNCYPPFQNSYMYILNSNICIQKQTKMKYVPWIQTRAVDKYIHKCVNGWLHECAITSQTHYLTHWVTKLQKNHILPKIWRIHWTRSDFKVLSTWHVEFLQKSWINILGLIQHLQLSREILRLSMSESEYFLE